ncbi:MAG: isoleucine--tRNA ligase [Candidatus Sumerlaeia bacterium]|nr:isoleucine--tRNA ligase [Candidatus Sumerlaeia bacterium]
MTSSSSPEKTDYSSTVFTPDTPFPQRGNLPEREPGFLSRWMQIELDRRLAEESRTRPAYVLHDGPPYANGNIHIGHTLNKVLKDIIVRQKTMTGHRCHYVPGWDCHGLPIEQKVLDDLRQKKESEKTPLEIRELCAAYAHTWIDKQREEFKRLGIGGDWEHPYLTLDPQYEAAIVDCLGVLVEKGYIYRGFKPVHWDPIYQTALAEAEIEYNEKHESRTIYLRFPLVGELPAELRSIPAPTLVIWTTTPWTIPANLGVSLNGELDYVGFKTTHPHGHEETLIIAKGLLDAVVKETKITGEVIAEFRGTIFDRLECAHPVFPEKRSLVMLGGHVTLDAGTGCVHTAPAHGVEDFIIGKQYDLPVFNPVDGAGKYTELYPEMQGEFIFKANDRLIEKFQKEGSLLHTGKLIHSYPYSWRSHKPVIMRATEQWFMAVEKDGLREEALEEIKRVNWIPKWGFDRIFNMVKTRPDWCLSRQRSWGVPSPSIRDTQTNESLLLKEVIDRFRDLVRTEGTDCWYKRPLVDFLPESMKTQASRYEKESNILDVWFDSGASHMGVLAERESLSWPADLYLEGSDQHRGWFQSSLWVAMGVKGKAPYKSVLTHGFVLDEKGYKMSKHLGNVVSPQDVIKELGADVIRLWVASTEYRNDVNASTNIIKQVSEVYRRIRNTFRFLLGNLKDFNPATDTVPFEKLGEDDQWVLGRLDELTAELTQAYDEFEFHKIYHGISGFCVRELGGIYLDSAKDRLYCSHPNDPVRRACQTALYEIASVLFRLTAPVLVFTADEAWVELPGHSAERDSVHLTQLPQSKNRNTPALMQKWEKLLAIREAVQAAIEPLRAKENKVIGNSLEAAVKLDCLDDETESFLKANSGLLPRLFIVSTVHISRSGSADFTESLKSFGLSLKVAVTKAEGEKCERCWVRTPQVGIRDKHRGLCNRCFEVVEKL